MDLQEAKNHVERLKPRGLKLELKTHGETCTTGCKVTVEVWGLERDLPELQKHFSSEFMKQVKGHEPNFEALSSVFDPSLDEVLCQACGGKFKPSAAECPHCGLCY